jgi:hypothetical protein
MQLSIIAARGLLAWDTSGTSDPFAIAEARLLSGRTLTLLSWCCCYS